MNGRVCSARREGVMGCNPFGRMISMACGRMDGEERSARRRKKKKRRRRKGSYDTDGLHQDGSMTPASTTTDTMPRCGQPTMASVVYSDDSPVFVMRQQETFLSPSTHSTTMPVDSGREEPRPTRVRFALPEDRQQGKSTAAGHHPGHHHLKEPLVAAATPLGGGGGGGGGSMFRFVPSPLPAREQHQGEYLHYPTPVREGIYRLATESNRLTTMFSEENPNACSIA